LVQRGLDRLAIVFQFGRTCLARDAHHGTDCKAQSGKWKVEREAAPGIEGKVARGGDCHRQNRPTGLARYHDDARPRVARLAAGYIRRHCNRAPIAQCLYRRHVCVPTAAIAAASGSTGAANELHIEVAQCRGQDFGVAMARQHDVDWDERWLDQGQ
jgi:hypothetical protein